MSDKTCRAQGENAHDVPSFRKSEKGFERPSLSEAKMGLCEKYAPNGPDYVKFRGGYGVDYVKLVIFASDNELVIWISC